ncbi:MAG: type III pantothenate kinase [Phycisphaerae bacterium]|nr:MAG: type III pantothenate kinase [Phycisphaerae bacterium]
MNYQVGDLGPLSMVVVDVGNSSIKLARWVDGDVKDVERVDSTDQAAAFRALDVVRDKCENELRQAIIIGSVVPEVTGWLADHIENELELRPFVVGQNSPLPIEVDVPDPSSVGVDRVCTAAAAFDHTGHGCTIVDVGSAITIDLIDDDGVFKGGTILPGPELQAKSLKTHTAQLPMVEKLSSDDVIGKSTDAAIQSGIHFGICGAIRGIVEQIATSENRWNQVVLTGGGAESLKEHLDFVDSWVPDLCLMGIGISYIKRAAEMRG